MEESSMTGTLDEHKKKRIEILSVSIGDLETKLSALERENAVLKADQEQLAASKTRIEQLERQVKTFEMNGSYDSEKTRVI
jgi:polyhydroxyalkanoate synthesis regulator phasin